MALWPVEVVAESDIESDTALGLEKVTVRLMGKRAVMSSHGGKKHLCLALVPKCKGEGDLMTFFCSHTK